MNNMERSAFKQTLVDCVTRLARYVDNNKDIDSEDVIWPDTNDKVGKSFKSLGYTYRILRLMGYRNALWGLNVMIHSAESDDVIIQFDIGGSDDISMTMCVRSHGIITITALSLQEVIDTIDMVSWV